MDDDFEFPQVQREGAMHDFITTAAAGIAGGYVGHKLDQTRFGVWINNSPTSNMIFYYLRKAMIMLVIGLAFYFVFFCLLPQF